MKVDIDIKANIITIISDKDVTVIKKIGLVKPPVEEPEFKQPKSGFLDWWKTFAKQTFPKRSQHTNIVLTKSAKEGMNDYQVSEEIVKDVIRYPDFIKDGQLRGKKVKGSKMFKDYNGYRIMIIAPYDNVKKIYLVCWVMKWNR